MAWMTHMGSKPAVSNSNTKLEEEIKKVALKRSDRGERPLIGLSEL
jgi:hypothetical protein